jgi:D-glycero-D-manno-heptose 1,7-bisphosphate phosphatase
VVIASNQSGLARGLFDVTTLNAIHDKMHQAVSKAGGHIDGIFYCPHGPDDNCNCRKPLLGLMLQIGKRFSTTLEHVPTIGDSIRDLQAAEMAGATPILVRTGKGANSEKQLAEYFDYDVPVYEDLAEAVMHLLNNPV